MENYKVYVRVDAAGRVLAIDGGYTTPVDLSGWVCIDEGTTERYRLCQSHYLPGALCDDDGYCRYRLENGAIRPSTEAEMAADRSAAVPEPTAEEDMMEMMIDHEYHLTLLELGIY